MNYETREIQSNVLFGKKQGLQIHSNTEWKWKWKSFSSVWLFATLWTMQFMEFSRPEYWSGLPLPSPGDLPNLGIKPREDSLPAEPPGNTNWKPCFLKGYNNIYS